MLRFLRFGLICASIATPAAAGTLHVPAQHATIQSAIDAAVAGDTVLVAPGAYVETIDFHGKAITVTSSGGADVTIIDGGSAGSVVTFASGEGPDSVLQGFSITGGTGGPGPIEPFGTIGVVGGGVRIVSAAPSLADLLVIGNAAADLGGGAYVTGSTASAIALFTDCTFSGNTATAGGGVAAMKGGLILHGCVLEGNTGGGFSGRGGNVLIEQCTVRGNVGGGGIAYSTISPVSMGQCDVNDCEVRDNQSEFGGGGLSAYIQTDGLSLQHILIRRTLFSGNAATTAAAISAGGCCDKSVVFTSCLVTGNGAPGVTALGGLNARFNGCTIADNLGPLCDPFYGCPTLTNCIVWGNDPSPLSEPSATWSDVEGGAPGVGNLDVDPQFVNPAGGDYHLDPASPCRDVGDPMWFNSPDFLDIDGEPRVQGSVIDMGSDEVLTDCNGNGQADPLDIQSGLSTDCDENGLPDECEPFVDCNGNGLTDSCDLALGLESDCDADGVPDSCQPFLDCNGNGIHDTCELAEGEAEDCNGNGVLDECDIASGASLDLDGNGQPDECQAVLLVPGEYPNIQAAIAAAEDGDTIALADGTYSGFGNVNLDSLGKELTIASLGGASHCVLDGGGTARLLRIGTEDSVALTTLRGLTLRHGQANNGGALLVEDSAQVLVEDCRFEACNAQLGGGGALVRNGATATFRRCVFAENTCRNGGALRAAAAEIVAEHCTFSHNGSTFTVANGGTLNATNAGSIVVHDSILRDGYAANGPEIYAEDPGSSVAVEFSDVEGGAAAVVLATGATLTWGAGNIDAEPLFKGAAAGDFRPAGGSPCIDTGDPAGAPDEDGTPPDMGAIPFAPWTNLGFALAGTSSAPLLEGEGALLPGGIATIALSGVPAGAAVTLVLGAAPAYLPFKGGTLVPAATLLLGAVAGPRGTLTLVGRWPAGVTPGFIAYLQAWSMDATAPAGFSASNGLAAEAR